MRNRITLALATLLSIIALGATTTAASAAPANSTNTAESIVAEDDAATQATKCTFEVISNNLNIRSRPYTWANIELRVSKGFRIHGYCGDVGGGSYSSCVYSDNMGWRSTKSGWYFARGCTTFVGGGWT